MISCVYHIYSLNMNWDGFDHSICRSVRQMYWCQGRFLEIVFLLDEPLLEVEPTETQARCLVSINSDATATITNKKDIVINTVFEIFQKPTKAQKYLYSRELLVESCGWCYTNTPDQVWLQMWVRQAIWKKKRQTKTFYLGYCTCNVVSSTKATPECDWGKAVEGIWIGNPCVNAGNILWGVSSSSSSSRWPLFGAVA